MGLRAVFKSGAQSALTAFGDVAVDSRYVSVTSNPIYDPGGSGSVTKATAGESISIIFDEYESSEIDGSKIIRSDQKALIPVDNLSYKPGIDDYITVSGVRWNVVNKETDPAEALWIIQIRKP